MGTKKKYRQPPDKIWTVKELEEYGRVYTPEKHQAYLMYVAEEEAKAQKKRVLECAIQTSEERSKDPFRIQHVLNLFHKGYSVEIIAQTFLFTTEQVERIIAHGT